MNVITGKVEGGINPEVEASLQSFWCREGHMNIAWFQAEDETYQGFEEWLKLTAVLDEDGKVKIMGNEEHWAALNGDLTMTNAENWRDMTEIFGAANHGSEELNSKHVKGLTWLDLFGKSSRGGQRVGFARNSGTGASLQMFMRKFTEGATEDQLKVLYATDAKRIDHRIEELTEQQDMTGHTQNGQEELGFYMSKQEFIAIRQATNERHISEIANGGGRRAAGFATIRGYGFKFLHQLHPVNIAGMLDPSIFIMTPVTKLLHSIEGAFWTDEQVQEHQQGTSVFALQMFSERLATGQHWKRNEQTA